jgi:hypothetical protein
MTAAPPAPDIADEPIVGQADEGEPPAAEPEGSASKPTLSPDHLKRIQDSAVSDEVALERGYRTVTSKAELRRLGFSDSQCRTPAMLVPIHGMSGDIVTYQIRPDEPRILNGKAIKYETPKGSRMALDVPPRIRARLADPSVPLFITEGARKADAAVTQGLCAVDLLGVWNWRGTNEHGGKVALPEFEGIAWNGRAVYLVFDSDVMTKSEVYAALVRLKKHLESRRADVKVIYLPSGSGGTKVGLDDFLAAGGTVDTLLTHAESVLRAPPPRPGQEARDTPYAQRNGRTYWLRSVMDGFVEVELANFTAQITSEVMLDDGVERRCEFEIRAHVAGRDVDCSVAARSYASLNWVGESLGARALISPGQTIKDHLRFAIQVLSGDVARRTIYAHTGWRELPEHGWVFLHADGAIGPKGPLDGIQVRLPGALQRARLPTPPTGQELVECVEKTLAFFALAPEPLTFPAVAAAFRGALGDTDFSIYSYGVTDSLKTETAALIQAFFGLDFDARTLPGSFLSTGNALEKLAFVAKDMVAVVDDWVPEGSRQDIQRQNREAGRLLRGKGNQAGRARLGADATLKEGCVPRALIYATGEELPSRHSARARALVLEFARGAVRTEVLTLCQQHRSEGVYAKVMAAFLAWAAKGYVELKARVAARAAELRRSAQQDNRHRRTASIIAELQAGFEVFLAFAVLRGCITAERAEDLRRRCWDALKVAAEEQAQHQLAVEPATLFLRLLRSAIASGGAHVAGTDGRAPANAEAFGWRTVEATQGNAPTYRACGIRVGWVDGDHLYLDPDAALKAAQELASDADRIPVSTVTLSKRLNEKGYLASTDQERGHLLVRRVIEGRRASVLHVWVPMLTGAAHSAHAARTPPDDAAEADSATETRAETQTRGRESGPQNRPNPEPLPGPGLSGPKGPQTATHTPGPGSAPRDEFTAQVVALFAGEVEDRRLRDPTPDGPQGEQSEFDGFSRRAEDH